jgi:hypothetical protein
MARGTFSFLIDSRTPSLINEETNLSFGEGRLYTHFDSANDVSYFRIYAIFVA